MMPGSITSLLIAILVAQVGARNLLPRQQVM